MERGGGGPVSRVQLPTAVTATRVIAVLRGLDPDRVEAVVGVLFRSGVTSVEITMDSPHAASSIERSLGGRCRRRSGNGHVDSGR
jgi:2-keto-3-deoxy-6-phosphogluconate aldolase